MNVAVHFHRLVLLEKDILLMVMKIALPENKKKQNLLKIKKFGFQNLKTLM